MTNTHRTHDGYEIPSTAAILIARAELTGWMRYQAERTAREVEFGYTGCPDAPSTYQQLRGAYQESKETGAPLPVSNLHCGTSIYLRPEDNVRFRFWHDVHHVQLGCSFTAEDELELATWSCEQLEQGRFSPDSLVYRMFRADLIGQIYLNSIAGRFAYNQQRFIETALVHGLDTALLDEMRFIPDPDARQSAAHRDDGGSAGRLAVIAP